MQNYTNTNCALGNQISYTYEFSSFESAKLELIKYLFVYKEYSNVLCPLSVYNTTVIVFTTLTGEQGQPILETFSTG